MAGWRSGHCLTIGTGIAVGVLGLLGGGSAHAAAIGVEAAANCNGPDTWVATWVVSISSDATGETWRLESSAGSGAPRPVVDVVVLEEVRSMDEQVANLDAVATILESGSTVSTAATVERPTACMSAPAPSSATTGNLPSPDEAAGVAAGATTVSTAPDPVAASIFVAPPTLPGPGVAPNTPTPDVASAAGGARQLPATGSTSGALVAVAAACLAGGALLVRLGARPSVPVLSGAASRHRQLSSRRTSSSTQPRPRRRTQP